MTSSPSPYANPPAAPQADGFARGALMVLGAALAWSFGGVIARFISAEDSWTVVAWRSIFAAAFLLAFMLWRDGFSGTKRLFRDMGWPGIAVGLCFAASSICFILALGYTTVANILLIQAGVPLIAALMGVVFLKERVDLVTWGAIALVIGGIAVMVSDSFTAGASPIGDALAVTIAIFFSTATVITRRHSTLRMTPAVCFGAIAAAIVGVVLSSGMAVTMGDLGWLFLFGAFNLGLGMALFVTGARLIPSALAALLSVFEPVLGPIWVWLVHGETPAARTLLGGAVVFIALLAHILWQWKRSRRTSLPMPN